MPTPLFYQLIHKPAFNRQLLALPRKDAELVIDKTELLSYDPAPDAKNKKRIVSFKRAICRIRAGRYRILYAFDANEGWVQILGVDDRKDVYRNGDLVDDDEKISLRELPVVDDPFEREMPALDRPPRSSLQGSKEPGMGQDGNPEPPPLQLPEPLTADLLCQLRIPAVATLRDDPEFADISRVWPFETVFRLTPVPSGTPFILHAEIWPGVVNGKLDPSVPIPDQAQVRGMVNWLAQLDAANELLPLFGVPDGLSDHNLRRILDEEGWIFGSDL